MLLVCIYFYLHISIESAVGVNHVNPRATFSTDGFQVPLNVMAADAPDVFRAAEAEFPRASPSPSRRAPSASRPPLRLALRRSHRGGGQGVADWVVGFKYFSRKTFRRRVLQKIVGVSHTTHIPHISHATHIPHISHTTHIPHISHTTHIPHISITPHISHTYPFKTYPTNTYPTNTYPFNTYPTSTYPCNVILSKRLHQQVLQYVSHQYVSVQHVSHQYVSMLCVSIQCVSIQKVCISRNRKRIPPIHIPPIRIFNTYPTSTGPFNAYPFKKFASAGMAMSMSIIAYHFIPLLLGGNGNEYRNLAFPSILCKIIN